MQQRRRGFRETYARYHADQHLFKKYIRFIKRGKRLPNPESDSTGGAMNACISIEEKRAIATYLRQAWFAEYQFNESPLQIGCMKGSRKLGYTTMKKAKRPISFQPGNKESLTAVDVISAAGKVIPSFLILSAKVLLEDKAASTLNDDIILTKTNSGCNNTDRAFQWLQHCNW
ncbi:hypothetical protein BKA60DRAFT_547478 [Fusarium oxysporum]|nr:hypothetical protein BKA60DRAFT_547478 [Fusarium oxysporum]